MKEVLIYNYLSDLDKTRIKTPEEYYTELINAPLYTRNGSVGYFGPERLLSKHEMAQMDKKTTKNYEEVAKNPLNTTEHIIAPIKPLYMAPEGECNFDVDTPINDLVSVTYLKHMYNRPLLNSCRYLIKTKIIHGEVLTEENIRFLSRIDKYLYKIYLKRNNLAAKIIKRKKTNAKRNKKTKARRNKKTKKI